jgi:hypothetical protein
MAIHNGFVGYLRYKAFFRCVYVRYGRLYHAIRQIYGFMGSLHHNHLVYGLYGFCGVIHKGLDNIYINIIDIFKGNRFLLSNYNLP